MRKTIPLAFAALLGLATTAPAFAQADAGTAPKTATTAASPDGTAGTSNFTGKGRGGNEGSKTDAGPSQNAGSKADATHGAR